MQTLAELPGALPPAVATTAAQVAVASDFVLAVLRRHPHELVERLNDQSALSVDVLSARLKLPGSEAAAMAALRRFRQIEMARIAWRDLAGWADLEVCLADLSALADSCIQAGLAHVAHETNVAAPRDAAGQLLPLLVLAMGKLGGAELNFSSDVDLVFLHPETEELAAGDDDALARAQAYYPKLAQRLIRLLDHKTDDGFVFRVDTRLRPFGASGPLVVSTAALESYLVQHGRDWERYAYVKARLVTGAEYSPELFDDILTPFVYRRYLDYGVFESLRQMKKLIVQEVNRRELAENIKLGPGGIREIEFIVQAFQLVRGGRNRELRTRSLLQALPLLASDRQLGQATVASLASAYRFLRTLENRLQAMDDRQTHDLPDAPEPRARLAFAMGEASWEALYERLQGHRAQVEREFGRIAWDASGTAARPADGDPSAAWETGALDELLAGSALAGDANITALLAELRGGALYQRMDEVSRQRLAAVIVRSLDLLDGAPEAAKALTRVLPVFRAVCRRSAYLALLNENPAALERLLKLAAESSWLVRQVADYPLLLDELLDERLFDVPPTREELAALFEQTLHAAHPHDGEATLEALRVFQRTAQFRIAIADRLGSLPLMKVSDRLTDTAELVLEFALQTAWRELAAKFGHPMRGEASHPREAGFAVIGYGKLGGLELSYSSDLDLVFLHNSSGAVQETNGTPPLENERFFARLVQRLIHFLTIQTRTGRLYEVDTRLRPSGSSGLMVSSLASFERYQRGEAWVWEHQALLRSRALAGSREVCAEFERIRRETLVAHVDRAKLHGEVARMRARMRAELSLSKGHAFDLKQDAGGIADIEFLVDYWVLANAHEFPELVEFPDNIRQLEALERVGVVSQERCQRLKEAYLALRSRTHELALDETGRVVDDNEFKELRAWIISVWNDVFDEPLPVPT
jgi:glutamate-ammonia-ligase adenylyltransferase